MYFMVDNSGKNTSNKVKKPSYIGKDKETLNSAFPIILIAITKYRFTCGESNMY